MVFLLVGGLVFWAWLQTLDPSATLWAVAGLLNLINLAMTGINLSQAWTRDRRFLRPEALGVIQLVTGLVLLAIFALTLGGHPAGGAIGLPFAVGGVLVLVVTWWRWRQRRREAA